MSNRLPNQSAPGSPAATKRAPEIQGSWQRCIEEYKLEPGRDLRAPRLTEEEISGARERLNCLLYSAEPVFDRLRNLGGNSGYCVLVTDASGIVLREYIDSSHGRELAEKGLGLGTVWTENLVGTNGLGTCLETGKALTVYADEHFGRELQRFSCSTAPLIAPDGNLIGALDISTYARGDKIGQGLALNLVCDTADQIEAAMFRHAFARHHLLALVHSPVTDLSQSTALIAANDSGWILGATSSALLNLGVRERSLLIGQGLAAMTGISLDAVHRGPVLLGDNQQGEKSWLIRLTGTVSRSAIPVTGPAPKARRPVSTPLYDVAGSDPQLLRNADICHRVLDRDICILLQGETGTGKEVWARAIHDSSSRCDKPFVTLNCAAIPETLIESELFGYSSGTFTGGLKGGKVGKIEASSGGTLFLDEIGDMPLALQARLLRVLAEREITPLGQIKPIRVNINVICATHRDLGNLVAEGAFREDLYYRISGVRVVLPALRERQDRSELIERILSQMSQGNKLAMENQALTILGEYHWPGNIRQLKNTLQFALCMCDGSTIRITDLPDEVFPRAPGERTESPVATQSEPPPQRVVSLGSCSEDGRSERDQILEALQQHRWVVLRAAEALGISRSTLHRKIRKYRLDEN